MSEENGPRNFDQEYNLAERKGVSFILGGHTFHTKGVAPPKAFLSKEAGLAAAIDFFQKVLRPEDVEVFNKMIDSEDILIGAKQLDDIAAWLIEELSGRPTNAPA